MDNTFTDSKEREWTVEYTVPDIIALASETKITLADISDNQLEIKNLFDLIWYGVRHQAKGLGINRKRFELELGITNIMPATQAVMSAFGDAFQMTDASEVEEDDVPFE